MKVAHLKNRDEIYAAADRFVEEALRSDGSLFTSGASIWTAENIEDLYERFVLHPDESNDSFEVKFHRQLEDAPLETRQLAAELLYAYFIFPSNIGGQRKRELIVNVLAKTSVVLPDALGDTLDYGIGSFGPSHTNRPWHLTTLIEFFREWKTMPGVEQALSDPWAFKASVFSVSNYRARIVCEALLHIVHPETFERIASQYHKSEIAEHFSYLISEEVEDVDRQILGIRRGLTPQYGEAFDFYDEAVRRLWQPEEDQWSSFIRWATKFYEWDRFDEVERDYKVEIADRMREAVASLKSGNSDWPERLKAAFGPQNNLADWRQSKGLVQWCESDPATAQDALLAIWDESVDPAKRIGNFAKLLPDKVMKGRGGRLTLASVLCLAEDPYSNPIYRWDPIFKAQKLLNYASAGSDLDEEGLYGHTVEFIDRFIEEAQARDMDLRDRLDAQSLVWLVVKRKVDQEPISSWSASDRREFLKYRGEAIEEEEPEIEVEDPQETDDLAVLAQELLLDYDYLLRIDRLLRDKGQIIFYGPPGTGKTYVGRRLAQLYGEGSKGASRIVQFHPSYSYEDFVEGYRPRTVGGQPGFALVDGPLKKLANDARENPNSQYVLVIDEINRSNLTKVMGELYFLLEYRGESVALQYSDENFSLPKNLWIICTMNTADRSIALVDAALRRRFYFAPFFPDEAPIEGLLRRWLERNHPLLSWVADVVDEANRRLVDRHVAIGPSYFLRSDLSEEWVEIIWDHSVLPYLSEQFFDEEERLEEFNLSGIRRAVQNGQSETVDETPDSS